MFDIVLVFFVINNGKIKPSKLLIIGRNRNRRESKIIRGEKEGIEERVRIKLEYFNSSIYFAKFHISGFSLGDKFECLIMPFQHTFYASKDNNRLIVAYMILKECSSLEFTQC